MLLWFHIAAIPWYLYKQWTAHGHKRYSTNWTETNWFALNLPLYSNPLPLHFVLPLDWNFHYTLLQRLSRDRNPGLIVYSWLYDLISRDPERTKLWQGRRILKVYKTRNCIPFCYVLCVLCIQVFTMNFLFLWPCFEKFMLRSNKRFYFMFTG